MHANQYWTPTSDNNRVNFFSVCAWLLSNEKKKCWCTAVHEIDKLTKELTTELLNHDLTIKSF